MKEKRVRYFDYSLLFHKPFYRALLYLIPVCGFFLNADFFPEFQCFQNLGAAGGFGENRDR